MNVSRIKNHMLTVTGTVVTKVQKVIEKLKITDPLEEVLCAVLQPTAEETRQFVKEHKLWCPQCKTDEFIVAEPVGSRDGNMLVTGIEYYCANPNTDSTVFTKCWHHVYSYQKGTRHIYKETQECTA